MIDLHTHILPGWDDGAEDLASAREMADIAYRDGIGKIALTPHVFKSVGRSEDPSGLGECRRQFQDRAHRWPVAFFNAAEVFIHHAISRNLKEFDLTINGSSYFFLEFPSDSVLPNIKAVIFDLTLKGYVPIISHPERNRIFRKTPRLLFDLIRMGCLGQVTGRSLTGGFGPAVQQTARLFLRKNLVHLIASDAHDPIHRPPRLSDAVKMARSIVGETKAKAMVTSVPQAILDNVEIGDWGEPGNPSQTKIGILRRPKIFQKILDKSAGFDIKKA